MSDDERDKGPPDRNGPGANARAESEAVATQPHTQTQDNAPARQCGGDEVSSRAVDWYEVASYVTPLLDRLGNWPLAGSAAWCALPDGDPRKIAGLFDAARRWALWADSRKEALAQASRDVSASADWSKIASEIRQRQRSAYVRRVVA